MSVCSFRSIRRHHGPTVAAVLAIALVATVLGAGPATGAVPCSSTPATFPTAQMTSGMTGTGYTVLRGDTIEPFTVEILGVMPNAIFLGIDVVAARITGPASFLATTGGAVAGMSGSPIYVNNRLAGAVAWAIAEDRHIFGMTAAEDMVQMFALQDAVAPDALPTRLALPARIRRAAAAAGSPLGAGAALEALPVPLGVSGLAGMPLRRIERTFSDQGMRVQAFRAGSVAAPTAATLNPGRFEPGDGLGVALSYGDVSFYGFGTTTAVCGDVAIGFGHPMFWGIGDVLLGMNEVDVVAIDNGNFWGTKIGTLGDLHGVLTQDRFAGVAGVFGELPSLVPITSDISSPDTGLSRLGETQVAWDQDSFVADATYSHAWSNLSYVAQQDGPGTVELAWTVSGTREDGSPFTFSNRMMSYDPSSATSDVYLLADMLYRLAFNEFEDIDFTGVSLTGDVTEANLTSRIARVRVSSPLQRSLKERSVVRARPGDVVRIEVTLDPVDGDEVVATTSIRVPGRARGVERVSLAGGRGETDYYGPWIASLDDLLAALGGGDHDNDLIVRGFGATSIEAQDVLVRGRAGFSIRVV
jgi:hypothetical protein